MAKIVTQHIIEDHSSYPPYVEITRNTADDDEGDSWVEAELVLDSYAPYGTLKFVAGNMHSTELPDDELCVKICKAIADVYNNQ